MCLSMARLDPRGAGQGSELPSLVKLGPEWVRLQQRAPKDTSKPLLPKMAKPLRLQLEVAINCPFVSAPTILRGDYVCPG